MMMWSLPGHEDGGCSTGDEVTSGDSHVLHEGVQGDAGLLGSANTTIIIANVFIATLTVFMFIVILPPLTILEDEVLRHEFRLDGGASGGVDEEADRLDTPQGEGPVDGGPRLLHVDVLALADGALDDEDGHLGLRLQEVKTVHDGRSI